MILGIGIGFCFGFLIGALAVARVGKNRMDSQKMKYKKNDWANFNDDRGFGVKYGIDVVIDGETIHVSENGKPLFFDSDRERDERIKELNQSI